LKSLIDKNIDIPVYEQIYIILRDRINDAVYTVGGRLPRSRALAEEFEVNHLTVRQALKKLESERRIHSKVGHGTFVNPNTTRFGKVLVLYSSLMNEFSQHISASLIGCIRKQGLEFEAADYLGDIELRNTYYKRIVDDPEVGGAIILEPEMGNEHSIELISVLMSSKTTVLVDRHLEDFPCSSVESDNEAGGYTAATHLIEKGCKRPAFLSDTDGINTIRARLKGFMKAIGAQKDICFNEEFIISNYNRDFGGLPAAIERLFTSDNPPDGLFCSNDFVALKAMSAIRKHGLSIPEDVAIIGFDDLYICEFAHPPLTTIRQEPAEMGRQALALYSKLIPRTEESAPQGKAILVPIKLVERESTHFHGNQ